MPIKPTPLSYVERIGPEPKFCPICGVKVEDDSKPCDACCETEDKLATMRAFGYFDGD
jgi:predicted amidophosphoribosyltransferase